MKLEDMVCSPEHAKKLKALEVKQESLFYWRQYDKDSWHLCYKRNLSLPDSNLVSAFTASELGEMLPHFLHVNNEFIGQLSIFKHPQNFACLYGTTKRIHFIETENNLSSALAKMLIHLIENKLIEVEKWN